MTKYLFTANLMAKYLFTAKFSGITFFTANIDFEVSFRDQNRYLSSFYGQIVCRKDLLDAFTRAASLKCAAYLNKGRLF